MKFSITEKLDDKKKVSYECEVPIEDFCCGEMYENYDPMVRHKPGLFELTLFGEGERLEIILMLNIMRGKLWRTRKGHEIRFCPFCGEKVETELITEVVHQ